MEAEEDKRLGMTDRSDDRSAMPVEPLTHRNAEGTVYQRMDAVETQIHAALALSSQRLRERVAISDQQSGEFLQEECLVYLIRHYHRLQERYLVSDLAEALLARCARTIDSNLRALGDEAREDGAQDVVEQLFQQIMDLESDRGDFFQVRFWAGLQRLRTRAFGRQLTLRKRVQATVRFSSVAGYSQDSGEEGDPVVQPGDEANVSVPSGEATVVQNDVIRDALGRLDEPFRSAFLLKHYEGWPIEHQDPTVQTISRLYGKDPRTIRNWLRKANEVLALWRGEQQ